MGRAVMNRFYPGRPSAMVKIDHLCVLVAVGRMRSGKPTNQGHDLNLLVFPADCGFVVQDGVQLTDR
jgi:hypothetical protein